ncbi:MAG TPA: NAD(+) synthase [Tepidisphaeraceae bacterium]|nr:NAD(+) synthase [Tepidisphaeraceae bacterium]
MQLIKLAAAVVNTTPLDWDGNRDRVLGAVAAARAQGVSILCLPELCVSGYGCEDAFHSPGVAEMAWRVLRDEVAPFARGIVVSVGLPVLHQNALFNTAALIADGRVLGFVAKRFLAGDGIHYEPRWFKPWPTGIVSQVVLPGADGVGQTYAIGDIHFDVGGVKIGFEICEDAWVAKRPGGALALEGVDVILNPSASHFAFGKLDVRKRFVLEGSRAFGVTYVYANLVGNESGRAIYDGGAVIASAGKLVGQGPRFTFKDFDLTTAVVDVAATRMAQARTSSFTPAIDNDRSDRVGAPFAYPAAKIEPWVLRGAPWEDGDHVKEEEFARAEALALFDYMRKSRSGGFVVSLSGGADSAAVCCLVRGMVEMGVADLGMDGFLAKIAYIKGIANEPGQSGGGTSDRSAAPDLPDRKNPEVDALMRVLLTTAYQASENSGPVTRAAARAVAAAVASTHREFEIGDLVKGYVRIVEGGLGRKLAWQTDDIALQNIQARVRAPSVWMLANIKNALILATSNRSEAAVGYATMDGDTSGGLSPVAGIDKNFLRAWLRWLEKTGPEGFAPVPALRAITAQAPTAELRPPDKHQTDEDDLMPYDLLDAIERAAIRDKRTPIEVYQVMRSIFPQHGPEQLLIWVERFFRLFCRNQWKRERYAPSFHLDDENLDPKTWCRFPILSAGYERELAELRRFVESEVR